jgi:antitoxin component of RelBE/YafQ-DinJ toxin-antitoxin module
MFTNKDKFNMILGEDLKKQLQGLADKYNMPIAAVIRMILTEYFESN